MIVEISGILLILGMIFVLAKVLGKRDGGFYSILYNLHKAGPALATILAFYHGLTITPLNLTYLETGWALGLLMISLVILGAVMGFKSEWIPYTKEQDNEFRILRVLKWILTILVVVALAAHYLLVGA
ncbi:MAG: hypothetical protein ACXAEF_07780 [Candidatus Thorarchaeota archaeon]|jgi:hypothetical protein